jgi:PIF1-like helicase/Helitron helicase-like domain at N-terminus
VLKLSSVEPVFRNDHKWSAFKYLEVEMQRIHQNSNRLVKVDQTNRQQNRPTGAQLLQQSMFGTWNVVNEQITSTISAFIRTGDTYFRAGESNINAMLKSFGLPQMFITMTFSERWPELQNIMTAISGARTLCTDHPWECVEFYYERMHQIWTNLFRKPGVSGFGVLRESAIRHEFQLRQAIHSHMLMWTSKSIQQMIAENFIRADLPDPILEPELHRLVVIHQMHVCRPDLCGRSMTDPDTPPCRKGFPHPLEEQTMQVDGELRYRYRRTKQEDRYVVLYVAIYLLLWKAHINVQYVTSAGLSKYVTKYVTKAEPKSIVDVQSEPDHILKHLEARRMGSMEVNCLLTGKPILKLSAGVQFLPNAPPYLRTFTVRRVADLEEDPDNPYYPDAIEKYFKRPDDLVFEPTTYPQYFRSFIVQRKRRTTVLREVGEWRDGMGSYVYRRTRTLLTRSAFRRLADGESFFYAMLLEKGHWRAEEELSSGDGGTVTYRAKFIGMFPDEYTEIVANQKVAQHQAGLVFSELYDEIINAMLEQHAGLDDQGFWRQIVQTQIDQLTRPTVSRGLTSHIDYALHMGADQYNAYSIITQFLGGTQQNNSQKLFFVTGSAGVGKSFILSALEKWVKEKRFKYLKLAPTGIAAINVEGRTIHSALSIVSGDSYRSTQFTTSVFNSEERQQELREISVLLIDEISMVSAELLSYLSSMFARLRGNGKPFGGIAVLAFGDLLQLPPVVGQPVFYANIWKLFCPLFLTYSHRQAGDPALVTLLNEVRVGRISDETWNTLVEIHARFSMSEVLQKATFIVSLRKHAQAINSTILSYIPNPPMVKYAVDRSETEVLSLEQTESSFKREMNLPESVDVKVGARVMFLDNSMMASGISNGTTGVVIEHSPEDLHPKAMFPTAHGVEVSFR